MLVFLELNEIEIEYTQEELIELFLGLANNKKTYTDVLSWIVRHLK